MIIERDDAKIGLMVIAAFLLFAGLMMHRSVTALAARETQLRVRLASASDLVVGTEVELQGLRVGQVNRIELERHGVEYTFLATLGVQKELLLWKGTRAVVISKVLGGSFLELQLPGFRVGLVSVGSRGDAVDQPEPCVPRAVRTRIGTQFRQTCLFGCFGRTCRTFAFPWARCYWY